MAEQLSPEQYNKITANIRSRIASGETTDAEMTIINRGIREGTLNPRDLVSQPNTGGVGAGEVLQEAGSKFQTMLGGTINALTDPRGTSREAFETVREQTQDPAVQGTPPLGQPFIEAGEQTAVNRQGLSPEAKIGLEAGSQAVENLALLAPFTGAGALKASSLLGGLSKAEQVAALTKLKPFTRMLVDAGRSPWKFTAIDSALSAAQGAGGEVVAGNLGPDARILGEIATAFGVPTALRMYGAARQLVMRKFSTNPEVLKREVGEVLLRELQNDPDAMENLRKAGALQTEIPGLNLTLGQATRRSNIYQTERMVGVNFDQLSQENQRLIATMMTDLKQAETLEGSLQQFKAKVTEIVNGNISGMEKNLRELEDSMQVALQRAGSQAEREALAEQAHTAITRHKALANQMVSAAYDGVGNFRIPPEALRPLNEALQRASRSSLSGPLSVPPVDVTRTRKTFQETFATTPHIRAEAEFAEIPDPAMLGIANKTVMVKPERLLPNPKAARNTLEALREFDSAVSRMIREANKGNSPVRTDVNKLMIIKSGINRVYDQLEAGFLRGVSSSDVVKLREANKMRREFARLFEDNEFKRMFAKTGQGNLQMTPGEAMKMFVPRNGGKAKEAAERLIQATRRDPEVLEAVEKYILRTAYASAYDEAKGTLNKPAFIRKLQDYSESIRAYGLESKLGAKGDVRAIIDRASYLEADTLSNIKDMKDSALTAFMQGKDRASFFNKLLRSQEELRRFAGEVGNMPGLRDGFRQALTDHIIENTVQVNSLGIPKFDIDTLGEVLRLHGDSLKVIMKPEHFRTLQQAHKALEITQPFRTVGAPFEEAAKEAMPSLRFMTSTLRQVSQRILSPTHVATDMGVRVFSARRAEAMREVFHDMFMDPKAAAEVLRATQNSKLAPSIKIMFAPDFESILFRPSTLSNFFSESARRGREDQSKRVPPRRNLTVDQVIGR